MKELSAFDISYLIKELDYIIGARIDKIYHPEKTEFIVQFHVANKGKQILRILLPSLVYIAETKRENPQQPSQFCIVVRKYLANAILREIRQDNFDRIMELVFSTKNGVRSIVVELFSKGNIIILDEEKKIINPLFTQHWKDRTIKRGEVYVPPKPNNDPRLITNKDLEAFPKDLAIVRSLAKGTGLGGLLAEEICLRSGVDKNTKGLSPEEADKIYIALQGLLKQKTSPAVIYKEETVWDIVPIMLEQYGDYKKKVFKSYSSALDSVYSDYIAQEKEDKYVSTQQKKIDKINRIIADQEKQITSLEKAIAENTVKAEAIYSNYSIIDSAIKELRKIRKMHSWQEIKEKLKGHKLIKDVNEKQGSIVLEI